MEDRVTAAMEAGETVVTATRRLARAWRGVHAERQQAAGLDCWDTPLVLPWDAWLRSLWEELEFAAGAGGEALLTPDQTAVVWHRLVASSDAGLMDAAAAARGADEAWRLMHAWRLSLREAGGHWGEDVAAFAGWADAFAGECRRHGWLDPAVLPDRLAAAFAAGTLTPPPAVVLAGFDELTPQQRHLLDAAGAAGARVEVPALPDSAGETRRTVCHDDEDELARAAGWARTRLASDPAARVAVVVPALATRRTRLQRVFDDVLQPRALLETTPRPAYNISLGRPLDAYPMVRAGLRILALLAGRIDTLELGALLRSPFVTGGDREAPGRAVLDARLRRRGEPEVWLVDVLRALRSGRPAEDAAETAVLAPDFDAALQRLFVHQRDAGGRRPPGAWAELFSRALHTLGWPGERGLDSAEYQQLAAWEDLLDRFAGLDAVTGAMDRGEALGHLRRLAADAVFQPRTPARRLQVMGPLEALGQRFDYVWIAGLDDEVWPPAPRPNPWLPAELQRRLGMPHAGAEREREYIERLTGHLLAAAPEVVVSHACWEGDRERAPSPVIASLPEVSPARIAEADLHLLRDVLATADDHERIEDRRGPALADARAPGGTGALAAQSDCPMRAFGRHRLGAAALERPRLGVDARERGQLLHRSLQLFFARHDSAGALAALDRRTRLAEARACAETAG
ncbi:PD-(D/E)XK nuclease family protein, partial [Salinisphaera sp. PC39]|uniref:PD-(D/E)XK nuclease family protein n=1 Tax=Salinisphaera sp. PC39 TaxID=1304156 RepID=UPI00333F800D